MEEDGEKLAQPRPEHEAVAQLTRNEAAYVAALKDMPEGLGLGLTDLGIWISGLSDVRARQLGFRTWGVRVYSVQRTRPPGMLALGLGVVKG